MSNRETLEKVKSFGMTNQILTEELSRLSREHGIELGHLPPEMPTQEVDYYPQFDAAIRAQAAEMAKHYEVFYSLERSIRILVSEALETAEGTEDWWQTSRVAQGIKQEVAGRIEQEREAGVTPRSDDPLDYTTFSDLSTIIVNNWDVFGGSIFESKRAVAKVMATLNTLRYPIAHCCPLAEDEQLRLRLAVRDWFRLME